MSQISYCVFDTKLGPCGMAWRDAETQRGLALKRFQLPEASAEQTESRITERFEGARKAAKPPPAIATLIKKVCKHLEGSAQDFQDLELDLDGAGPFARQVYDAARKIPPGKTQTYGEIALAVDKPGAARAVGQALGKNPIALIIPCHRVLASGGPGGFSAHGGCETKFKMLAIEGATIGTPQTLKSPKDFERAVKYLKSRDKILARCLHRPLEMKLRPSQSPYATLLEAIVHQQLTPKAASTILARVKALFPAQEFPGPTDLQKTPDELLRAAGLSKSKTIALKDLAAKTIEGTVPDAEEIVSLGDQEIIKRLTSIYGVGQWTVEMMLIFNLGRADVFPVDDYAIRKCIASMYGLKANPPVKEFIALAETWRPYRTVASLYLWNSLRKATTD